MKKLIDLAQIEARENELEAELAQLRSFKKYASKYGSDIAGDGPSSVISLPPSQSAITDDILNTIRIAIDGLNQSEFNSSTLEQVLARDKTTPISRSSIFDGLKQLKETGEIQTIHKGAGRRPAVYKSSRPVLLFTDIHMPKATQ
jgi:hypothetical protein